MPFARHQNGTRPVHFSCFKTSLLDWKSLSLSLSHVSWDVRQHQFNFVRRLSWSISSICQQKIHSMRASQPKNSLKTHIFGVQGRSRSSMLAPSESSAAVLVMICSKSVYLQPFSCYISRCSSRNCTFSRGYANLMCSYKGLREPRGSKLHC